LGVFLEWIDPIFFGGLFVGVKFAFVAFEAFAKSEGRPIAGFVNGAFVQLRIAETFGKNGAVSVFLLEVFGKFAQRKAHAAGGEVGLAAGFQDEKSPQLGDKGQAGSSGERIPVDPIIAVFESQSRPRPAKDGTKHGEVILGIGLVNALPDGVSGGSSGLEVVFVIEGGAELSDLKFGGGLPDFEVLADGIERRADVSAYHDSPNLAVLE